MRYKPLDKGDALDQSVMDFQEFMRATPSRYWENDDERRESKDAEYLGYFLRKWIEVGNGVELTAGSYKHYLRTCVEIANMCIAGTWDNEFCDESVEPPVCHERTIKRISDEDDPYVSPYADEMLYDIIAYRRSHPFAED